MGRGFWSHDRNKTNTHFRFLHAASLAHNQHISAVLWKQRKICKHAESQEVREKKEVQLQLRPEEDEETSYQEMQTEDRKVRDVSMLANVSSQ